MNNSPIGIFDSGVGGLTVLKEIEKLLALEDIIYFGDTARVPYGNKSKSTIVKFSRENTQFLLTKKVKIVVVACNTSSALALDELKEEFNVPILGVIESGVRKAVEVSKTGRIGVIGTRSTIKSKGYQCLIKEMNPKAEVYARDCPLFVPLAEEGILNSRITREAIKMYLKDFKEKKIDTLVLGCTHYPLFENEISDYLKGVRIVNSAKEVASHTRDTLAANNLLSESKKKTKKEFYLSDESEGFAKLARLFLKRTISDPKVIDA